MNIQTMPVGELEANCHILSDSKQNAVLIDPGAEPAFLLDTLAAQSLKPVAILLTHAHFDHFGAAAAILRQTGIPLYVHTLDRPLLQSAEQSLAEFLGMGAQYERIPDPHLFAEGDVLRFGEEIALTVLHTPGHTPGSVCFRSGDILFSGDTLFRNAVGRVDFQGGSIKDIRASLRRLGALEGDCTVYCGHYGNTTLSYERANSPYLVLQSNDT